MVKVEISLGAWQDKITRSEEGPAALRESLNDNTTFEGLLSLLASKYPGLVGTVIDPTGKKVYEYVVVIVNGRFLDLVGGNELCLKDGDKITLLPFLAGG